MSDVDTPPRKPIAERLKPITDRLTREAPEHPDPIPEESAPHPVTGVRPLRRRERVGAD